MRQEKLRTIFHKKRINKIPYYIDQHYKMLLTSTAQTSVYARNTLLLFVALTFTLFIMIYGISGDDLIVGAPVPIPFFGAEIPLVGFLYAAPLVYLMIYLNVLITHNTLYFKSRKLRDLYLSDKSSLQSYQDEIHGYFFTQLISIDGMDFFYKLLLRLISILILFLFPILLLVYFESHFLPYHSENVTFYHRFLLIIGMAMILFVLILANRTRSNRTYFSGSSYHRQKPFRRFHIYILCTIFLIIIIISNIFIRMPNEPIERLLAYGVGGETEYHLSNKREFLLDRWFHTSLFYDPVLKASYPDLNEYAKKVHKLDKIDFRGRDLSYADLTNTKLEKVNLQGANLLGANLSGAQLTETDFSCSTPVSDPLSEDCKDVAGADLRFARLQNTKMDGVKLVGSDLTGADFRGASLVGAWIQDSSCADGATFEGAELDKARFVNNPGRISFRLASMREVKFESSTQADCKPNSKMTFAALTAIDNRVPSCPRGSKRCYDFAGTDLTDAEFSRENELGDMSFVGATLKRTKLNSVKVSGKFYGTDLTAAELKSTDLRSSTILGALFNSSMVEGARFPEGTIASFPGTNPGPEDPPLPKKTVDTVDDPKGTAIAFLCGALGVEPPHGDGDLTSICGIWDESWNRDESWKPSLKASEREKVYIQVINERFRSIFAKTAEPRKHVLHRERSKEKIQPRILTLPSFLQ